MISRRDMIWALAAPTPAALHRAVEALLAIGPQPGQTPVSFRVPAGATDCHVHVFCDSGRFPFSPDRPYTPHSAPVEQLRSLLRALQMDRVVIVSPAVYGTNHECTLDAIRRLGARARGIALVAPQTTKAELDKLHRGGIRGTRLNIETLGVTDPQIIIDRFRLAARQAADRDWHIQINTRLSIVEVLEPHIQSSSTTVVFDHFAQAQPTLGVAQPGLAALMRLLRAGRAYVKVSAAYRISTQPPDYADVAPVARELIATNPERILWGSDWPHPDAAQRPGRRPIDPRPPLPVDDGRILNQLAIWAPDPAIRRTILVDNPARLYGF